MAIYYTLLGTTDYKEIYNIQRGIASKKISGLLEDDFVLFLEHRSVFTLGKRGGKENLTVSEEFLKEKGVDIVHVERGGNITYHGEGQIVVYPIINLKNYGFSIKDFVAGLEDVMIKTASDFGVKAKNDETNRGCWVGNKKIGSVGIAVKKSIVFHGLSLNVNLDLTPFTWINPCGLEGVSVTSLEKETGKKIDIKSAYKRILINTEMVFGTVFEEISVSQLKQILR